VILTGPEIVRQVHEGRIYISPFNLEQVNPNSYNFRLGSLLKGYDDEVLDVSRRHSVWCVEIGPEGYMLLPNRIYLGHTVEVMGSDTFVPIIRARSSIARLGLFIHITADLIDIGSINQWTLQLHAVQPIRIYSNMLIGQVTFWCVKGEIVLYNGKYQGSMGPQESKSYLDFQ
jgi:dCTP deaminase